MYKQLNSVKCKDFYWQLVENKDHIHTCISEWHTNYKIFMKSGTEKYLPFKVCREIKFKSFQNKLIHRIIACNAW